MRVLMLGVIVGIILGRPAYSLIPPKEAVFVHLFEWKWTDVEKECREVLGPAGFHAIQVSPPHEHIILPGRPWYERYQVVSYQLESRGGTREQFARMVLTCRQAGVAVYVDAVINHTTRIPLPGQTLVGSAGTVFSAYSYPGLYEIGDFHRCGRNGNDSIVNYNDRWEVQNCNVANLADLKTESPKVQQTFTAYLRELLDLGVAGFRIDAAKHIPSSDLGRILEMLQHEERPFVYQEVIDMHDGEIIPSREYFPHGSVISFRYGADLARMLKKGGKLAWLNNFGEAWNYPPSNKMVVFVDNHDTQRGHVGNGNYLTYKDGPLYDLANIFMLAWPYGYPQIMSSFEFTNSSAGPSPDALPRCGKGWVCEHRRKVVLEMVKFRRRVGDRPVVRWWSNGHNQIAFGRGDRGFVVINHEGTSLKRTFATDLPAGTYREHFTGKMITVNARGEFSETISPRQALAISHDSP